MNDDRVETLAKLVLVDDEGRPVRMGDAWKDRPVILTFLRHYG
jgi:hypothetical protein